MKQPDKVDVQLDFKLLKLSGTWQPTDAERKAAWELYVELVTRVAAVDIQGGSLREALTSVYSIFPTTRSILRSYGPTIAEPKPNGEFSFGYLAIGMLNFTIRPRLAYWHPTLSAWEEVRAAGTSVIEHEANWDKSGNLRADLMQMARELRKMAGLLSDACNVPDLSGTIPT